MSVRLTTETYRPPGWPYPLSMTFDKVVEKGRVAQAKARRKEPLNGEDLKAILAMTLLRDCYITDEWVWRLACEITGKAKGTWHCDPYFNVWSHTKDFVEPGAILLDGHEGRDGLAVEKDGKPSYWVGDCLVNGPHSVTEKWIGQTAIHGRENYVATVVQVSGQKWLLKYGMQCDVCVELGRMNYVSPPGLPPAKCNPLGSALLLWIPHLRQRDKGTHRKPVYEPTIYRIRDKLGKEHTVLARAGRGGSDTKSIIVP